MPYRNEYPKLIPIRTGEELSVKLVGTQDAGSVLKFFKLLSGRDSVFLRTDLTEEESVARFLERSNAVRLMGMLNGDMVGQASMYKELEGWTRHVGELRVVVSSLHQGKGISIALLKEIVHISQIIGISKLMARVVADDKRAVAVLYRLGFSKEATLSRHATDRNGRVHDMLIFSQQVDDFWAQMEEMNQDFRYIC
jgi:RimJ/RimL family protein N-acetyltransferase